MTISRKKNKEIVYIISILVALIFFLLVGAIGYLLGSRVDRNNTFPLPSIQVESGETPKQDHFLVYREECRNEYEETANLVDKLVNNIPNITKEQAQNIGKRVGIVDNKGYVIEKDVWVSSCIERKISLEKF